MPKVPLLATKTLAALSVLAMPTPPETINAPVDVDTDSVLPKIVAVVLTTRPCLTMKSLLTDVIAISFPFH
jgi:hypothetical protein